MEFNLTSFILETINFLVLVWILQRLFYAPVKRAMEARKAAVRQALEGAEAAKREAAELRSKYENRLGDWERERALKRESFQKEMEKEKEKGLASLRASVEQERGKLEAQEGKRRQELMEKTEKEAIRQSLEFASRLLSRVASPETERKIVGLALEYLEKPLSPSPAVPGTESRIRVNSAYPLPEPEKKRLATAFQGSFGWKGPVDFAVQEDLLAGLEISMGAVVLRANLRDELGFFAEADRP